MNLQEKANALAAQHKAVSGDRRAAITNTLSPLDGPGRQAVLETFRGNRAPKEEIQFIEDLLNPQVKPAPKLPAKKKKGGETVDEG